MKSNIDSTGSTLTSPTRKWIRSKDGWIAGVCEGIGHRTELGGSLLRILWLAAVFLFGTGLLMYLLCAWLLPREDRISDSEKSKFFGVCRRIAYATGLEIGLVRVLTVLVFLGSCGTVLLLYFVFHFLLKEEPQEFV